MVHQRRRFGNWGEDAAVRYLKTRGYEILDRNYRSSWGEIDIIARQQDVLAFVEVKAPGKKPRVLQVKRHEKLRELGFRVFVLDALEDIPGLLQTIAEGGDAQ